MLKLLIVVGVFSSLNSFAAFTPIEIRPEFYSAAGGEFQVRFRAEVRTSYLDESSLQNSASSLVQFVFGPMTHRSLGGPRRNETIKVAISAAKKEISTGKYLVPLEYQGSWVLDSSFAKTGASFEIPLPYDEEAIFTPRWKSCTDSAPDHQTRDFFWYFWDPKRSGCDHALGTQFQNIKIQVGERTPQTKITYPEYQRMVRTEADQSKVVKMTFAFGYVEDPSNPNILTDSDSGIFEFRKFYGYLAKTFGTQFKKREIRLNEYPEYSRVQDKLLGYEFTGVRNSIKYVIKAVVAAEIDQMDLFAKSFAHDHDSLFAWMGHSRVGSGFDANRFKSIVSSDPSYYSITNSYQVVYWGGCNSYSYYSDPFFNIKGGTKNLDLIVNVLPSYFMFNADNAWNVFQAFFTPEKRTSYKAIVDALEERARKSGLKTLSAVLGDEDNN